MKTNNLTNMKTTTNTRNTGTAVMSQTEEKAMALMCHLGNNYFVCNGILLQGTEETAREEYQLYLDTINPDMIDETKEPLKCFEEWAEENIEPVDDSLDAIEAEGYKVCTDAEEEPCSNVINYWKINGTTYYICKREDTTNNAQPTIEDCIEAIKARLHGDFDNASLLKFGYISSNSDEDILMFIHTIGK